MKQFKIREFKILLKKMFSIFSIFCLIIILIYSLILINNIWLNTLIFLVIYYLIFTFIGFKEWVLK